MSHSTTLLDLISASQAQKEVTANAGFDAASPATLFGRRASTCSGLTWGYYGGTVRIAGTLTQIANGTVALTASNTNYVEATPAGVVSKNIVGFTAGSIPLYTIVCAASSVTSYTDQRITDARFLGVTNQPRWVRVGAALPYTDFQTAGLTKTNTLFALAAGQMIHAFKVKHFTLFTGAAISTVTASIGIAGDHTKYVTPYDIKQAVPAVPFIVEGMGVESDSGSTNITITLDSTGANLSALSQGVLEIWALLSSTL